MKKPVVLELPQKDVLKAECKFRIFQNNEVSHIIVDKAVSLTHDGKVYILTGGEGFPVTDDSRKPHWSNKRFMGTEAKKFINNLPSTITLYGI